MKRTENPYLVHCQELLVRYKTAEEAFSSIVRSLDQKPCSQSGRIFRNYRAAFQTPEGQKLRNENKKFEDLYQIFYKDITSAIPKMPLSKD